MEKWPSLRAVSFVLPLALIGAGCADNAPTSARFEPVKQAQPGAYRCDVDVRRAQLACGDNGAGLNNIILGGQGIYVLLSSSNVSYDAGTGSFTADVTVQNLIPQPLGTLDGVSGTANGVRVFFPAALQTTGGTGVVSVIADGVGNFLSTNEPYFEYSGTDLSPQGFLATNATSAPRTWTFNVPASVTSFSFGVYVHADVPNATGYVDITGPSHLMQTTMQQYTGTVRSAVGNVLAETITWGTGNAGVASISPTGLLQGVTPGTTTVLATAGSRSGSANVSVCPTLNVGEAYTYPAGTSEFCLGGTVAGQEYTIVTAASNVAAANLSLTGAGITAVTGGPSPGVFAAAPGLEMRAPEHERDHAFERALRERERTELSKIPVSMARVGTQAPTGLSSVITPGVPALGALMSLNASTSACSPLNMRTGRVEYIGTRVIIMSDTLNPAGGFTPADYASIGAEFDNLVWPRVTALYGSEADIDTNGRVIAFYTRAVNELTPPGSGSYVGGFFFSRDLFSSMSCAGSNEGEIFYMLAPDPAGAVNGNVRATAFVRNVTVATLAHEYQHLINASRRMYVNPGFSQFEEVWMNEGLSHIAEEEVFYAATGLTAGSNIDVNAIIPQPTQSLFFQYAEANFGRFRSYLLSPTTQGPIQSDDDLATRGAAWAFLRYLSDRTGNPTLFYNLLNTQQVGVSNLNAALGTSALDMMRDWQIAVYADEIGAPLAQHRFGSWNYRSIYNALSYGGQPPVYPLAVRNPANGVADAFSLSASSSAYSRLRVPASGFATFTLQQAGGAPAANVSVSVIRRQ